MPSELDERVGIASRPRAIVLSSRPARKRIECGTQRRPTHRVEESFDEDSTTFAGTHFERSVLHIPELLRLKSLRVVCMSRVCAVSPETGQAVVHRLIKERLFLERCGSRRLLKRPRGAGHQREMSKTQLALLDGRDALGKDRRLRRDGNRARGRGRSHAALQAHPVRRAQASLPFLLLRAGERSCHSRELQLDSVDDPAQSDQLVPQNWRIDGPRAAPKTICRPGKIADLVTVPKTIVAAITHFCSIHTCVWVVHRRRDTLRHPHALAVRTLVRPRAFADRKP